MSMEKELKKEIDYSKFKPFDRIVLAVKTMRGYVWTIGIFAFDDGDYVQLLTGFLRKKIIIDMLPFEGNEHLVGKRV